MSIFVQFWWNLVKMTTSWLGQIAKKSAWYYQKCGFFINNTFLSHLRLACRGLYTPFSLTVQFQENSFDSCHASYFYHPVDLQKMKLFSQILAMLFDVLTSLLLVLKQNGLKFLGCLIDALHTLSYVRKIPAWKIC